MHVTVYVRGQETTLGISLHFPTCFRERLLVALCDMCTKLWNSLEFQTQATTSGYCIWLYTWSGNSSSGLHLALQMLCLLNHLPSSRFCFLQYISSKPPFLPLWGKSMLWAHKLLTERERSQPPLTVCWCTRRSTSALKLKTGKGL